MQPPQDIKYIKNKKLSRTELIKLIVSTFLQSPQEQEEFLVDKIMLEGIPRTQAICKLLTSIQHTKTRFALFFILYLIKL